MKFDKDTFQDRAFPFSMAESLVIVIVQCYQCGPANIPLILVTKKCQFALFILTSDNVLIYVG